MSPAEPIADSWVLRLKKTAPRVTSFEKPRSVPDASDTVALNHGLIKDGKAGNIFRLPWLLLEAAYSLGPLHCLTRCFFDSDWTIETYLDVENAFVIYCCRYKYYNST